MANFLVKVDCGLNFLRNTLEHQVLVNNVFKRFASKKTGSVSRNSPSGGRPKYRRIQKNDGTVVTEGTILATQYQLRWCPGLNVGAGNRGTLYAKVSGKVVVTCEKAELDKDHIWVKTWYPDRTSVMYKKYINVIPNPQHNRFKLIDQI